MMLPMVAFVFAVAGAVAGDFLPGVTAYYQVSSTTCSGPQVTEQNDCEENLTNKPICTILVNGNQHPDAFAQPNCTSVLRRNIP